MTMVDLQDFFREMECLYDEEKYSVRDNGAVLRHPRVNNRVRPTDNQWTFGKPNSQNGYMYISQVRIHRIVATAFHGAPPTAEHVVDHIDTNRRNNRPENLRWLTRLENALLNPITVKRIEFICGSIEAFLEDPSRLNHSKLDRDFGWMRTVSLQEAQACRERMHLWAKSETTSSGGGSLGEWVYKPIVSQQNVLLKSKNEAHPSTQMTVSSRRGISAPSFSPHVEAEIPDLVMAKTPGAAQRKWRTPTEFPNCPATAGDAPIAAYAEKLTTGAIFAQNSFSKSLVLQVATVENGLAMYVMCENAASGAVKPWSVTKVTYEDGLYVHTSVRTFFAKDGAEKEFCLARGLEWTGGDSIDDYC